LFNETAIQKVYTVQTADYKIIQRSHIHYILQ